MAPDDFIPAVERCRRMSEIDRWVVLTVLAWIEQHPSVFEALDGFSINLSGESMNSEDFLAFLKNTLASSNIALEKITFEVTETVAAENVYFTQQFIKQIKRYNCKFSLDDFGSGYSSYSYLKSLDVDFLKIDGVFVKDMLNNSTDVAIVRSMNEIAHSLGLKTIAEYVENDQIHALLHEIGVDYAQGWGWKNPCCSANWHSLLATDRHRDSDNLSRDTMPHFQHGHCAINYAQLLNALPTSWDREFFYISFYTNAASGRIFLPIARENRICLRSNAEKSWTTRFSIPYKPATTAPHLKKYFQLISAAHQRKKGLIDSAIQN
nr:EAL domain-containing protein [Methylomarinum sp. Ch1-1]MDP4522613.1 EAL domain-containing protein [Methylomarinum sp. Ch1-1]